jgi:long-chain acyl-CoA synthetase
MLNARSVADLFLQRIGASPDGEAFQFPAGDGWKSLKWREVGDRVRTIAAGLRALGLADEERCSILSGTRLEWILIDFGILCAGGATTTIYPSSTADECAYILKDSDSRFAFVENDKQVAKLVAKRAELPSLKNVIVVDGEGGHDGWVVAWRDLEQRGEARHKEKPNEFEEVARAVKPESLATLIYTSGTTGQPKGVELTHDCWVYEGKAIEEMGLLKPEDLQYLWLPLSHSFGKVLEAGQLQVGFTTAVDGRMDKLVENLAVVKPTFVAAVPRVFEKVHNKVVTGARDGGGMKLAIFRWAMGVGREVSALRQKGQEPGGFLGLKYKIADSLVFSKLRARFGGRVRFFISGSAPLARDLSEFFHAAGILVLEGYGLTETSAGSFVNRPDKFRFGTVGVPFNGTEVKIAKEDGEILLKGRGIMRGYRGLPDATRETKDDDGWLHTGDIGEVDPDGFLRITDRKKDLIKTSGGKYVAPQALEGKLKAICPYLSQVLVHGNNRNFCTALVTLDEEAAKKWGRDNGLGDLAIADLAKHAKVIELIQGYFNQLNKELPSYESIKKFAILPADLSQEAGDLTPSLKVKRKVVEQKNKELLDGFYAGAVAEG